MTKKYISPQNEKKLLAFLEKRKKTISPLLILTHNFPDPDALASAYALHFLANRVFQIRSRIVYKGLIGRAENRNMVNFLELPVHKVKPREIEKFANTALVDTQPAFENNSFPADRRATLIIDQHTPLHTPCADLSIIDTECGATCVILAKAILSLKIDIPERLATALAYGIISDTLNLYRAKRPDIISTYLKVLSFANIHTLARIQIPQHDKNYFQMLDGAITKAQMRKGLMVSHLGKVSNPDLVSQIAEFFLFYKKTEWVLVTGRFNSKLHASLRTKYRDYDAATVLRECFDKPEDAGGHGQIAGGSMKIDKPSERKWHEEERKLTEKIAAVYKFTKKGEFYHPFA
jgi:nanoRNase/pAp phosphatase (c-di-AMP/oligoRNAs hydrolase)